MDVDFADEIKPKLFAILESKSLDDAAKSNALQALAVILATEPERNEKKIDWLFTYHLEPPIHRAVDALHGAHDAVTDEETKLLPTYLRVLNALLLFSSQAHRQEALDSCDFCSIVPMPFLICHLMQHLSLLSRAPWSWLNWSEEISRRRLPLSHWFVQTRKNLCCSYLLPGLAFLLLLLLGLTLSFIF